MRKKSYNKGYAVWCFIGLFLVMALKSPSVGADWVKYLKIYDSYSMSSYADLFNKKDEFLYYWFAKFLHDAGVSHQAYIAIVGFIVSIITAYFVYKETDDIFLGMFLHLTIGNFTMTMSGVRQTVAICIIILAYFAAKKKQLIWFLVLVYAASLFHASAIVFLPFYWILKIRLNFKSSILIWLVSVVIIPFKGQLVALIEKIQPERYEDRYDLMANENPINPLVVIVAFAIPIACLLVNQLMVKDEDKFNSDFSSLFILSCVYTFSTVLAMNSLMLLRLGFYFVTFNVALIPNVINRISKPVDRKIAYFFALLLPAIQFIISTPEGALKIDNYEFFWN